MGVVVTPTLGRDADSDLPSLRRSWCFLEGAVLDKGDNLPSLDLFGETLPGAKILDAQTLLCLRLLARGLPWLCHEINPFLTRTNDPTAVGRAYVAWLTTV